MIASGIAVGCNTIFDGVFDLPLLLPKLLWGERIFVSVFFTLYGAYFLFDTVTIPIVNECKTARGISCGRGSYAKLPPLEMFKEPV